MPSGIADYSFELLPLLAERARVDVFCPSPRVIRRLKPPPGIPIVDPNRGKARPESYDAVFYHLGNNPAHKWVYEAALAHPGINVFHDFVLHHLIAFMMVEERMDAESYRRVLTEEYGESGLRLAELRLQGAATDFEKFVFPANTSMARRSRSIVVHSEDSAERMREIAPDVPVWVIPHHAGTPPREVQAIGRAAARSALGLPPGAFLVGHFGYITRPKQPAAVLGGFSKLAAAHPNARLVMIGADKTGGGMQLSVRRLGLEGKVILAGYVDLPRFYLYLRAVDAVINLRYPSAGESSGTFARALAEGRPAIVNNLGSFAEVPVDVALKVEIDGDQAEQVGEHLLRLAEDPAFRARVEVSARSYAASVLDPVRCRDLYLEVARQVSLSDA